MIQLYELTMLKRGTSGGVHCDPHGGAAALHDLVGTRLSHGDYSAVFPGARQVDYRREVATAQAPFIR